MMKRFFERWRTEILLTIILSITAIVCAVKLVDHVAYKSGYISEETTLPEKVIVIDRTNKTVITYNAYPKIEDGILYIREASVLEESDISHMVE